MRKDCVSNCMVLFGGMRELQACKGAKMPQNAQKRQKNVVSCRRD